MSDADPIDYASRHEHLLRHIVENTSIPADNIKQSILYSLFPGGKRLRPMLVYLCGELTKAPIESLDYIAIAIELTHCYSLIHDDLPAMDDDDMRRGKPSCHKQFGEATAILAGDGMQALAIEILLTHLPKYLSAQQVVAVTQALVNASGPSGMVSGQSLDLTELSNPNLTEKKLCTIHQLKTGRLIKACMLTAIAAGDSEVEQESIALKAFADHFGLLFQMQDDYLDCYHNHLLGKGRSSDDANDKRTYANLFEKNMLDELIQAQYTYVFEALHLFGSRANRLKEMIYGLQAMIEA
jgi:farnesyl diphosphate synthase